MRPFRIGVIADIHVGSMFGVWHPDAIPSYGGKYTLHIGQRYLWDNWLRIAREIPTLDMLVWNGDLIDGKQPRDSGRFLLEPEIIRQAEAFLMVAEPFQRRLRGRTYVLRGTRYHDEEDIAVETIGRELGAICDHYGRHSWDWLLLDVRGVKLDIAHAQSVMLRYVTTALEREGQFSDMAGLHADVIVRSHSHRPHWHYLEGANELPLRLEISTPAWQLATSYVLRGKAPNRAVLRNLGMVIIEIGEGVPMVRPFLFPHPPFRREEYQEVA